MAYINPSTGQIVRPYPITSTSTPQTSGTTNIHAPTPQSIALGAATLASWHKAFLWFLGAVLLVALAGPAPNVATMLLLVIIVGTLLGNWQKYAAFLGLANKVTGGQA
jgi:hypothetical protein